MPFLFIKGVYNKRSVTKIFCCSLRCFLKLQQTLNNTRGSLQLPELHLWSQSTHQHFPGGAKHSPFLPLYHKHTLIPWNKNTFLFLRVSSLICSLCGVALLTAGSFPTPGFPAHTLRMRMEMGDSCRESVMSLLDSPSVPWHCLLLCDGSLCEERLKTFLLVVGLASSHLLWETKALW